MALAVGVTSRSIAFYESGQVSPRIGHVHLMAAALDCHPADLFIANLVKSDEVSAVDGQASQAPAPDCHQNVVKSDPVSGRLHTGSLEGPDDEVGATKPRLRHLQPKDTTTGPQPRDRRRPHPRREVEALSSIPGEDESVERERLGLLFVTADEAIAAGFDVLPAAVWLKPDGTLGKAPLLVSGHLGAHRDRQLIKEQLIDPPHRPPSVPKGYEVVVGVVPGSGGCGVLDCDVKNGKAGQETYRALVAQYGEFVTAAWRSPSGGANVLFRKPTGASYGNHSPWPGIDVRSDGGWVVAPGCTTSWGSWRWARGRYTAATALPVALTDQLTAPSSPGRKASNAETVGFIEASPTESTPDAAVAFQREMVRFRSSGVGSRHDALMRIVAWAFGMHALDLRSVIDEIKAEWQHLTAGEGREDEVSDIACRVAGKEIDQRQEAALSTMTNEAVVWETPVRLRVQPRLPTFPDEKLPSWLGAFTRTVALATQTPIDLSGVVALASVGVAVGGRAIVEVRPGWDEPLNVRTVANLPPGARKSAVVAFFSRPFFVYQRDVHDKVRLEIIEKETLKRAAEASLSRLIREQDKPEGKGTPIDEVTREKRSTAIQAAARVVEEIEIPSYPRLLADDATPEALASLMAEQKGRIGVLSSRATSST